MGSLCNGLRVAFIGLGVMGYPMAGHLARAGHDCRSFTTARAPAPNSGSREYGDRAGPTPAAAAARRREFVLRLRRPRRDVDAVTLGLHGAFGAMRRARCSSITRQRRPDLRANWRRTPASAGFGLCRCAGFRRRAGREERPAHHHVRRQRERLRQSRARDGGLCQAMPSCWAQAGAGQLTKMVNQICIAGVVQGLSEGLSFARAAGLDPASRRRSDLQRCCAILADGEPPQDDAREPFRTRLCRRVDAQGSGDLSRRSPQVAAASRCRSRR